MESRSYETDQIQQVIDWIDERLKIEFTPILRALFKQRVLEYLDQHSTLDENSFMWGSKEVRTYMSSDAEGILEVLEDLKLLLQTDLLIEKGRNCLVERSNYESFLTETYAFLKRYRGWDPDAFDPIIDKFPFPAAFEGVRDARAALEELKVFYRA
jgi:hypothetical protein